MHWNSKLQAAAAIAGFILIVLTLTDGFYTIVLPRRVRRIFRITGIFYRSTWTPVAFIARRIKNGSRREEYLSVYGPLSLIVLIFCWAVGIIAGFGLLHWAAGMQIHHHTASLAQDLYSSASALVMATAELPDGALPRWLITIESGIGFGFLGLVIGYLPVLYQSYSSRELRVSLLDARAGSPPTAGELLVRQSRNAEMLQEQLADWEEWIAELLSEQISYPMLAYSRSQHPNQSWLAALTALLDASAVITLTSSGDLNRQAQLTFAIGRHALVDLATVFRAEPLPPPVDRLPADRFEKLRETLISARSCLRCHDLQPDKLARLREMYEPLAYSLGVHFLIALPEWLAPPGQEDIWQKGTADHEEDFAVSDPFQESTPE